MRQLIIFISFFSFVSKASTVDEVDSLVKQWTQLEQQYHQIDLRWKEKKPILEQRLALLREEKQQLESRIQSHRQNTDKTEQQRLTLLKAQLTSEQHQSQVSEWVDSYSRLLEQTITQLPPFLQRKWSKELNVLKEVDNVSEKLAKQIEMLVQLSEFDQRIGVHVTLMPLPDGEEIQVTQLYLGLSQGWYVSEDGRYWGQGHGTSGEWVWQHQPQEVLASKVLATLAILDGQHQAELVELPIHLQKAVSL